jgi:hypothetical protein
MSAGFGCTNGVVIRPLHLSRPTQKCKGVQQRYAVAKSALHDTSARVRALPTKIKKTTRSVSAWTVRKWSNIRQSIDILYSYIVNVEVYMTIYSI